MSCDLLENAKQAYKTTTMTTATNGITPEPNSTDQVAIVPKAIVENKSLDHVFLSYTNVSSLFILVLDNTGDNSTNGQIHALNKNVIFRHR